MTNTLDYLCKECGEKVTVTLQGRVPKKIAMFYFECPMGHLLQIYIPKNMRNALEIFN